MRCSKGHHDPKRLIKLSPCPNFCIISIAGESDIVLFILPDASLRLNSGTKYAKLALRSTPVRFSRGENPILLDTAIKWLA